MKIYVVIDDFTGEFINCFLDKEKAEEYAEAHNSEGHNSEFEVRECEPKDGEMKCEQLL